MRITLILILTIAACVGVWAFPAWNRHTPEPDFFVQDGREFNNEQIDYLKNRLQQNGISGYSIQGAKLLVPGKHRAKCNEILRSQEFAQVGSKKEDNGFGFNVFSSPTDKADEKLEKKISQLQTLLARLSGIREARIMYSQNKFQSLSQMQLQTASVFLWASEGEVIGPIQASTARQMLSKSFAGMKETDVLVVDGDTGMSFSANNGQSTKPLNDQLELETARTRLAMQAQQLLTRFGQLKVEVRMDLHRKMLPPQNSPPTKVAPQSHAAESEVVPNGTGRIGTKQKPVSPTPQATAAANQWVIIKRILGIEVSIPEQVVENFIRRQTGFSQDVSEDQFSRGMVTIRNEITKELVRWLRTQKGIELASDLVSVAVIPGETKPTITAVETTAANNNYLVFPVVAGIGLVAAIALLLPTFRPNLKQPKMGVEQSIDRGRRNVNRQPPPERDSVVDAEHHSTSSERSSRTFPGLVAGDPN